MKNNTVHTCTISYYCDQVFSIFFLKIPVFEEIKSLLKRNNFSIPQPKRNRIVPKLYSRLDVYILEKLDDLAR